MFYKQKKNSSDDVLSSELTLDLFSRTKLSNEKVSTGDTEISHHIHSLKNPGEVGVGGYSGVVKTETLKVPRSA